MVTNDVLERWVETGKGVLRNGQSVTIRKAQKEDIPLIGEYLLALSTGDRRSRYLSAVSVDMLRANERLIRIYDTTLDHVRHESYLVVSMAREILGVVHAWETEDRGVYEVSYSRRSDHIGCGVGRMLMESIISWAERLRVRKLVAVTLRDNSGMRKLFERNGFHICTSDDPTLMAFERNFEVGLSA